MQLGLPRARTYATFATRHVFARQSRVTNASPMQGPTIQEVDDEEHVHPAAQRPHVEEPEDSDQDEEQEQLPQANTGPRTTVPCPTTHATHAAHAPHPHTHPMTSLMLQPLGPSMFDSMLTGMLFPSMGAMGGASASSFSSSYSSSGAGGQVTFSRMTTTRVGPNGVVETTESVHDGRTGQRRSRVARRLGDREHVVSMCRDTRGGVEERQEVLNNIRDDADRQRFEQEWSRTATRSLLGTRERSNSLRGGRSFERSVQPRLDYQGWM